MDHSTPLVLNVAVALAIAVAGGFAASWLRQSPILGYLLAGVLIGPFTPGFVGNREQIASLADVGVIFLMFALGVAFSLKDLARVRNIATIGTLVQVLLTICGGMVAGSVLGWSNLQGIFFGAALAASSSMVILKTLLDRGEIASGHGRLLLSMAIVQDLIVVVLIVILPMVVTLQQGLAPLELATDVAIVLVKAAVFIGMSLAIGLRLVPWIMGHVSRMRSSELFIVTAAVLALGAASVSTVLGLSAALGAFVAGLVLSESEFDHRVIAEVVPVRPRCPTTAVNDSRTPPGRALRDRPRAFRETLTLTFSRSCVAFGVVMPWPTTIRRPLTVAVAVMRQWEIAPREIRHGTGTEPFRPVVATSRTGSFTVGSPADGSPAAGEVTIAV